MTVRFAIACLAALALVAPARPSNWNVEFVNSFTLPKPKSGKVVETSCVTYAGPVGDAHRFIAAQQDHRKLVRFDVTFSDAGAIEAIDNVVNIPIEDEFDFEGIAFTDSDRNSVFLSEEDGPGVCEISLENGEPLQSVAIPSIFTSRRDNRGFESLTRTLDGETMWTANEEALRGDGPVAKPRAGTVVRLLRLDASDDGMTAGPQYAYKVEPIHSSEGDDHSGLSDLVAMPDGTLLALERSEAKGPPKYLNRIFEVNLIPATDVSAGLPAYGLRNQAYVPVAKELLWSGSVGGDDGQNFEGLGLGPRLANGAWVLLGTVDSSSGGKDNTIVAFTAAAKPTGDFNRDGLANGQDFMTWQRGIGTTVGAKLADGDGDRDGDVDRADLDVWKAAQPMAARQ